MLFINQSQRREPGRPGVARNNKSAAHNTLADNSSVADNKAARHSRSNNMAAAPL
jgi:hypothetical protein